MKKLFFFSLAALMVLCVSCKKDDKPGKGKYGVDGETMDQIQNYQMGDSVGSKGRKSKRPAPMALAFCGP